MADTDKTLGINIELKTTGQEGAAAAKTAVKEVADESIRYQQVLQQMAEKDASAAQDKRWAAIAAQAAAYVPIAKAAADAEKLRAEASLKMDQQLKDLGHSEKEAGEGTEEHTGHQRAAMLIFSEMNRIVPELGHAIHAAFAGPIGPLILLTLGIEQAYSALKEFNETLEKSAATAGNADFLSNITDRLQIIANAAASAQAAADSVATLRDNYASLNTKLKETLDYFQAIERAQAAQMSAQKALDIAKIQQDEAGHKITPEQAAERRAIVEKHYLANAQSARESAQDIDLNTKQAALNTAQQQQAALKAAADAAAARVTDDQTHAASVKLDPAAQLKAIADLNAELNRFQEIGDKMAHGTAGAFDMGWWQKVQDQGGEAGITGRMAALQKQLNAYNATQTPAAKASAQADADAAAEAKRQFDENTKLVFDLTQQIRDLTAVIKATRPIEEATTGIQQRTVDTQEAVRRAAEFDKDFRTLDKYARSKDPSATLLEEVKAAIADIIALLKDHQAELSTLPDYAAAIADLNRDMSRIKQQNANMRPTQGGQG